MPNPKTCKSCREKFQPKYSTLEKFCTAKPECRKAAYDYAKGKIKQAEKRKLAQKKKDFNWSDTKWLKSNLQDEVNRIVRSIDRGLTCLATDTNGQMHAGHIFSRGGHTQMRYNLHNIHRQSAYSNDKQSHDGLMQEKLSEEYGPNYLEFLRDMRGLSVPKWSVQELGTALDIARVELRSLNSDETEIFTARQRVTLRNQINLKLGLYSAKESIFNQYQ